LGYNRAIESAEKFPDAQVTAVDIDPMLPRSVTVVFSSDFSLELELIFFDVHP
jgi:hypothetical protein